MQSGVCLCANAHPGLHPGYEYMSKASVDLSSTATASMHRPRFHGRSPHFMQTMTSATTIQARHLS